MCSLALAGRMVGKEEVTEVVSQRLVHVELQVELVIPLVLLDQGRQDLGNEEDRTP